MSTPQKPETKTVEELHEDLSEVIVQLNIWQIHLSALNVDAPELSQCLGQLRAGRTWLGRYLERTEKDAKLDRS